MSQAPHPVRALAYQGAGDRPMLAAIVVTLSLQAAMVMAAISDFLRDAPLAGLEIAERGLWLAIVVGVAAVAFGGCVALVAKTARRERLCARAEVPALLPSLRDVPARLADWSSGGYEPEVAYHMHYADACYTTGAGGRQRIVLGTGFGRLLRTDPASARFKLAHEFSHTELGAVASERRARVALVVYLLALSAALIDLAVTLAFLVPSVVRGRSVAQTTGFERVSYVPALAIAPDAQLVSKVLPPLILVAVAALAVIVFSYFVLVRRELHHDLRAAQLTADPASGVAIHERRIAAGGVGYPGSRVRARVRSFLRCHPSPEARIRCLREGDLLLVDATTFPVIVGALVPSSLLSTDVLGQAFGADGSWWTLAQATLVGLLVALGIRADGARFAFMLPRSLGRTLARVARYAAMMSVGSSLVGVLLLFTFGHHSRHDAAWYIGNASEGLATYGKNTVFYCVLLCAFALLCHLRVRSTLAGRAGAVRVESTLLMVLGVIAFALNKLVQDHPDHALPMGVALASLFGLWTLVLAIARRPEAPNERWRLDDAP